MKKTFSHVLFSTIFCSMYFAAGAVAHPVDRPACGLRGSITERIDDCRLKNGVESPGFVLVLRTSIGAEVHEETATGLLWSDRLPESMTQAQAEDHCRSLTIDSAGLIDVKWKLPTLLQYRQAILSRIDLALPDADQEYWTSSVHLGNFDYVYSYVGLIRKLYGARRSNLLSVRCVARTEVGEHPSVGIIEMLQKSKQQ